MRGRVVGVLVAYLACWARGSRGRELSVVDFGAVAEDTSANQTNVYAFNAAFAAATAGDEVVVPEGTWHMVGGVAVENKTNVSLDLRGSLNALPDLASWPLESPDGDYLSLLRFTDNQGVRVRSSTGSGWIDGNGKPWWNLCLTNQWPNSKGCSSRPTMLEVVSSSDVLIERLSFLNAPNYHVWLQWVERVEVGFVYIMVDRQLQQPIKARLRQRRLAELGVVPGSATDMALQPEDLNTDGIDVSGKDVWIHDCEVHNDDDSIAIKSLHSGGTVGSPAVAADCSGDMLVENVVLAGFGASIGSVPPNVDPTLSCVNNVTFRNVSMPDTGKGIYLKSNPSCGEGKTTTITNVAFHTVDILRPRSRAHHLSPPPTHRPLHPSTTSSTSTSTSTTTTTTTTTKPSDP